MPRNPAHQQPVVRRLRMPHGRPHRHGHRFLRHRPPRRTPPDPPAPTHRRVCGYRPRPLGRTAGKQPPDLPRERVREPHVLLRPAPRVPQPAPPSGLRVRQAPLLGQREGRLLDKNPLSLVPTPPPVEPHHHRRQRTRLPRPPRQRRVTPRQKHQMPEIHTVQTARRPLLHHQQRKRTTPALGAVPPLQRLNDDKPGTGRGSCDRGHNHFIPQRPRNRSTLLPAICHLPSAICHLPPAAYDPCLPLAASTLNTDTRARCRVGRSISSTAATARSAYDR